MSNKNSFAAGVLTGAAIPSLIIGLVGIAAIVGAIMYARSASWSNQNANANANSAKTISLATASVGANPGWSRGAANAPITLEEFADFECGACGKFEPTMREIRTIYGDRVRVVFRQFPLVQVHQKAYDAARAAEAAGQQGKFWEMHDLLYDKQAAWVAVPSTEHRKLFSEYAKQLGLDVAKFESDSTNNAAINERVAADLKRGNSAGVSATPTIYFNGRKLKYPDEMTTERMRQLIDQELQQK